MIIMVGLKKNRRGYYFTFDAVVGIIILAVGIILIAGYYYYIPDKTKTDDVSSEIISILSTVKINDVCYIATCDCGDYVKLESLCDDGDIENSEITLIEYIGELYSKPGGSRQDIEDLIDEVVINNGVLPRNYDIKIMLNDPAEGVEHVEQLYPLVP